MVNYLCLLLTTILITYIFAQCELGFTIGKC